MNVPTAIKSSNIIIRRYHKGDELAKLDLTDADGIDPLHVAEFFRIKATTYQNSRLCSIWSVFYNDVLVGCFTLTMSTIRKTKLEETEVVDKAPTLYSYPAVLLGQIGVDKKFRGMGIGSIIIKFATGLSRKLGNEIACRYLILQTSKNKIRLYASHQFYKETADLNNNRVWMYRKLYV